MTDGSTRVAIIAMATVSNMPLECSLFLRFLNNNINYSSTIFIYYIYQHTNSLKLSSHTIHLNLCVNCKANLTTRHAPKTKESQHSAFLMSWGHWSTIAQLACSYSYPGRYSATKAGLVCILHSVIEPRLYLVMFKRNTRWQHIYFPIVKSSENFDKKSFS